MLYSFLSQINKGLRRIDILRKSEIGISQQGFGQKFGEDDSRFPGPDAEFHRKYLIRPSRGNRLFFISCCNFTWKLSKTPTEREYEGLQSELQDDCFADPFSIARALPTINRTRRASAGIRAFPGSLQCHSPGPGIRDLESTLPEMVKKISPNSWPAYVLLYRGSRNIISKLQRGIFFPDKHFWEW